MILKIQRTFIILGLVLLVIMFFDMNIWNKASDPLTNRQTAEGIGVIACMMIGRIFQRASDQ